MDFQPSSTIHSHLNSHSNDNYATIRSNKSSRNNNNINQQSASHPSRRVSIARSKSSCSLRTASPSPSSDSFDYSDSSSSVSKRRRTSRDTLYLEDPSSTSSSSTNNNRTSWTSMADTTYDNPPSNNGKRHSSILGIDDYNARRPSSSSDSDPQLHQEEGGEDEGDEEMDSSFDKRLDSLLNATMIALEASNSLLLSTLQGRSDLVRFRAAENSLEELMNLKEIELKYQLENTSKLSNFVDKASNKLDDLIESERNRNGSSGRNVQTIPGWGLGSRIFGGAAGGSNENESSSPTTSSHWRKPSIGSVNSISGGIRSLKSKDEDATIGKTAAKRLEKVLKTSQEAQEKIERDQASSSTSTSTTEESSSHSRKPSTAARDALGAIVKRDLDNSMKRTASAIDDESSTSNNSTSSPTISSTSNSIQSSESNPSSPLNKSFTFPINPNPTEDESNKTSDSNPNPNLSNQTIKLPFTPSPSRPSLIRNFSNGGSRIKLGQSTPSTPSTSIDDGSISPLNELMMSRDHNYNPRLPSSSPTINQSNVPPSPSQHRRPESRASSLASIEESSNEVKPSHHQSGDYFTPSRGNKVSSRNTSVSSLASIGGLSVRSSNGGRPRSPLIPWNDGFDLGIGNSNSNVGLNQESVVVEQVKKNASNGLADALGIYSDRVNTPSKISKSISDSSIKSNATTISPTTKLAPSSIIKPKLSIPNLNNSSQPTSVDLEIPSTLSTPNNPRRTSREFSFGHSKSPSLLNGPNSPSAALSSSINDNSPFDQQQRNSANVNPSSSGRSKGRNGALEALKRLNHDDNDGVGKVDNGSNQTSGGGWGGFGLASWIGFGSEAVAAKDEIEPSPQHVRKASNASTNSIGKRPGMMRGEVM